MLYGQNYLYIAFPAKDFLLTFSPYDLLELCKPDKQKLNLYHEDVPVAACTSDLNLINIIPNVIEAHLATEWKNKDFSKVKDLQAIERTIDWSFCSPHKGTISNLSDKPEFVIDFSTATKQKLNATPNKAANVLHLETEIPIHMLGVKNPILHYGQVTFYEDEYGDKGYSKANVRYRV